MAYTRSSTTLKLVWHFGGWLSFDSLWERETAWLPYFAFDLCDFNRSKCHDFEFRQASLRVSETRFARRTIEHSYSGRLLFYFRSWIGGRHYHWRIKEITFPWPQSWGFLWLYYFLQTWLVRRPAPITHSILRHQVANIVRMERKWYAIKSWIPRSSSIFQNLRSTCKYISISWVRLLPAYIEWWYGMMENYWLKKNWLRSAWILICHNTARDPISK